MPRNDPTDPTRAYSFGELNTSFNQYTQFEEFIVGFVGAEDLVEEYEEELLEDFMENDPRYIPEKEHITPASRLEAKEAAERRRLAEEAEDEATFYPTRGYRYFKKRQPGQGVYHPPEVLGSTPADSLTMDPMTAGALYMELPTATKDPVRPRTVAAFYDWQREVLTIMFRDGTLYNYYEVSIDEWKVFRTSGPRGVRGQKGGGAKGGPDGAIEKVLSSKESGPADISELPQEYRQKVYATARKTQYAMRGMLMPGSGSRLTAKGKPRKRAVGQYKSAKEQTKIAKKGFRKK